jgi:hypothetical protein
MTHVCPLLRRRTAHLSVVPLLVAYGGGPRSDHPESIKQHCG